jgi:hypothetical protein
MPTTSGARRVTIPRRSQCWQAQGCAQLERAADHGGPLNNPTNRGGPPKSGPPRFFAEAANRFHGCRVGGHMNCVNLMRSSLTALLLGVPALANADGTASPPVTLNQQAPLLAGGFGTTPDSAHGRGQGRGGPGYGRGPGGAGFGSGPGQGRGGPGERPGGYGAAGRPVPTAPRDLPGYGSGPWQRYGPASGPGPMGPGFGPGSRGFGRDRSEPYGPGSGPGPMGPGYGPGAPGYGRR